MYIEDKSRVQFSHPLFIMESSFSWSRISRCHREDHGFKSRRFRLYTRRVYIASIVQLAERLVCNQEVGGSIPS